LAPLHAIRAALLRLGAPPLDALLRPLLDRPLRTRLTGVLRPGTLARLLGRQRLLRRGILRRGRGLLRRSSVVRGGVAARRGILRRGLARDLGPGLGHLVGGRLLGRLLRRDD